MKTRRIWLLMCLLLPVMGLAASFADAGHEHETAPPVHEHEGEESDGEHAHQSRAAGVVDSASEASLSVTALDMKFEPHIVRVQAGVPTRIELENAGATEHSLIVKTPDGRADWIHLHVQVGGSDTAVYRLDEPGRYPILCTVPGHQEAGMVGELVVAAGDHRHETAPDHH